MFVEGILNVFEPDLLSIHPVFTLFRTEDAVAEAEFFVLVC